MKIKKSLWIPAVAVLILAVVLFLVLGKKGGGKTAYTFGEITKGDIENTVDASGTIEPVTTVEVGTQVSGIIDKIFVDFNDRVRRNQLMAVIDTTILSVQVRDAKASVLRNQAQYDQAKYNYDRSEKLFQQNLISEYEFVQAKSSYQSALSSLMSTRISLERAEQNMRYAFIRSPIDGTVIYREVEEGQTVASSFQTPRLFLIAEDLSKMEIHALVDESEIGQIKVGQAVRFEVQAHDDQKFTGTVRQVWLQPETVQNVVNYTVVVDAENPDGLLLPGMTAMLDFIVEMKKDVLLAPVAAAKVQATESMMQTLFAGMRKRFETRRDSAGPSRGGFPSGGFPSGGFPSGGPRGSGGAAAAGTRSGMGMGMGMGTAAGMTGNGNNSFAMIWYLDQKNDLQAIPVRTGSTDGKNIEIIPMPGPGMQVEPGMKVITRIETDEPAATQQQTPRPPGFGRMF
ncbi:efflux RND transporter periplasmic adaptor subunit [bacterium]|nr:efflux RND transporter periplasmic adaptor subunit [bacterium]